MKNCKHIRTSGFRELEKDGKLFVRVDCDDCHKTLEADAFRPIPPFPLKEGQRTIQAMPETWKIDGVSVYHGGTF